MTRREQIIRLAESGLRPVDIAERLGTTIGAVNVALTKARRAGLTDVSFPRGGRPMRFDPARPRHELHIAVPTDVLAPIVAAAERRDVCLSHLVGAILDEVGQCPALLDNILDDA